MLACMLAVPRRDYARLGAETGPPAVTVSRGRSAVELAVKGCADRPGNSGLRP